MENLPDFDNQQDENFPAFDPNDEEISSTLSDIEGADSPAEVEQVLPSSSPKPTDPLVKKLPKAKAKFPPGIKLRTYETSVARHIAKIYVNKSGGDMADTIRWIKPGFEEVDYLTYAKHVLQQEKVRIAIDEEYKAIGVDEDAKKIYIGKLWQNLAEGNDKTKQVVLGLLGRALGIGEMADDTRIPVELPIKGMEKGWSRMTGKDAIAAQNPTGFSKMEEEGLPSEDDL